MVCDVINPKIIANHHSALNLRQRIKTTHTKVLIDKRKTRILISETAMP